MDISATSLNFVLKIIKWHDSNGRQFSTFVLCTKEESKMIKNAKAQGHKIDLNKMKVLHRIEGHTVSDQLISGIKQYIKSYNNSSSNPVLEIIKGHEVSDQLMSSIEQYIKSYNNTQILKQDKVLPSNAVLQIVKARDLNNECFSAFVLCTPEESKMIKTARAENMKFDLTKMKILYMIKGHEVSDQLLTDALEYLESHYNLISSDPKRQKYCK